MARLLVHIVLLATITLTLTGEARAQKPPAYRIGTVPWAGWSPLHVAEAEGFWRDEGVAVTVVSYDDPVIILEAIKAERIDFAMDMAGSLVGLYMDGVPAVILAETNWSHGGDKIIVKAGHDVSEYRGEPIGVFLKKPSCLYFLDKYLTTVGLRVADFRIVELEPDDLAAQFIAGRIPVILDYDPHAVRAVKEGDGRVLANSAMYEGCVPECLWGYRARVQRVPDEDLRRILRGWIRAVRWTKDPKNWPEYMRILNDRTFANFGPYTEVELRELLGAVKIHSVPQMYERNKSFGGMSEYLVSLRAFLDRNDMLKKDYTVVELLDNRLVMEVLEAELREARVIREDSE